ncbi:hypothetical protein V7128_26165 [Neobacillus vireti]|uniref:hypothetical protein n=1 Tax=Neobacillus vireti TaxID=220686 RepID=UPI002FFDCF02
MFSWLAIGSLEEGLKALRPKINDLLNNEMNKVKKLVTKHSDFVHAIATQLLKRGDLTGEEIEAIYLELYGENRPGAQNAAIQREIFSSLSEAASAKEIIDIEEIDL